MPSLLTWYHTLRHLKPRQYVYLLWRPLAMACSRRCNVHRKNIEAALSRDFIPLRELETNPCYKPHEKSFRFLNIEQVFDEKTDWNFRGHGLLWAYHLNYFEWLYDEALTPEERLETLRDYASAPSHPVGHDAYPISLRTMSWIRFLLRYGIRDEALLGQLFANADWLCRFPEYHLDGNHLFENALALIASGSFFQNERLFHKGSRLLTECLHTQVLPDGAHVEGSLMYHSLLLWRCLQSVELLQAIPIHEERTLQTLLCDKAAQMLGWLEAMSFSDGTWPLFHDSAEGMAPALASIQAYAAALGLKTPAMLPKESGYRMFRAGAFELAINAAPIQPAYQPGHAHADIASFCLFVHGKPILVDTGVTIYEPGARRAEERSSAAHNTVAIGGLDSSEMWRTFRVGRRAKLLSLREEEQMLELCYEPALNPGCRHLRRFLLQEDKLRIEDELTGAVPGESCAYFHFHPQISLQKAAADKLLTDGLEIDCSGAFVMSEFRVSKGFNRSETALRAAILFTNSLFIEIKITRW
ncbi:MAG: alginate lyase family protein [Bacteroidetes bacterium]|nr:alginate lyase family protein [Bacteroidota bacterium]